MMALSMDQGLIEDAAHLLETMRAKGLTLASAESCTGGLIGACLTEVVGSSDVFERGFITYSNAAKTEMLGVDAALIGTHGAVSEEVARAMAEGALARSRADIAVSVTGVAGPGGGSAEKPVGLVHIAAQRKGSQATHERCTFGEVSRGEIRRLTVIEAFGLVRSLL